MLAHGIIITKGKWVSLLRLRGDVRYQEDVREKEDRRWLPEATLAASRQEPTGIQAWFQAFDGEKRNLIEFAMGLRRQNPGMEKLGLRSQALMT